MNETVTSPVIFVNSPDFIVLALLSCVSGFMAIGGNAVVLFAIYRTKSLHTISNFFIASLAAADLLVGIFLNPLLAAKAVIIFSYLNPEQLRKGSAFDKAEDFAWIQAVVATTFGLTAISGDRYIAVNFGLRYEQLASPKRCIITTATVWLISLVFASIRLFTDEPQHLSILWLAMGIITCILPFVIITFCYLSIFKAARQQVRKILHESSLPSISQRAWSENTKISHRKTALTVAIVIVLFIVLWVPSLITAAVQLSLSGSNKPKDKKTLIILEREVWMWVSLVAYISSASNPWVYSIRCKRFRASCKRIFKCANTFLPRNNQTFIIDGHLQSTT